MSALVGDCEEMKSLAMLLQELTLLLMIMATLLLLLLGIGWMGKGVHKVFVGGEG